MSLSVLWFDKYRQTMFCYFQNWFQGQEYPTSTHLSTSANVHSQNQIDHLEGKQHKDSESSSLIDSCTDTRVN